MALSHIDWSPRRPLPEKTMPNSMQDSSMQACIDACRHCQQTCLQMAMSRCLETGGQHVEPEHFRLMINCAEICQTAANFMLSHSPLHAVICNACAQICTACADSCEHLGDMDDCVQACRQCAKQCEQMAQSMPNFPLAAKRSAGTSFRPNA